MIVASVTESSLRVTVATNFISLALTTAGSTVITTARFEAVCVLKDLSFI